MSLVNDVSREVLGPVGQYIEGNNENIVSTSSTVTMESEHKRLQQYEQQLVLRERELARREAEVQRIKLEIEAENLRKDENKKLGKSEVNLDELFPATARPRQIQSRELEIGPSIGSGKFADVNTAWLRVPCAVKKMRGNLSQENLANFQREAAIMNACNHQNVIKLLGFCSENGKYYLVQELVTGGNLHDRMHKKKQHLTYQQVVRVGLQVASGLAHLHSRNIVHRDIKPHNFVIDTSSEPAKVKLCDFGLARVKTGSYVETEGRIAGTPAYQAPEMLKLQPITEKVDQYSFAILVWEMITCQLPWWGKTFDEMVHCVTRLDERPAIPADCPEPLAAIVRECWQPSPELRPPFDAVYQRLKVVNDMLKSLPEFRSKVGPKPQPQSSSSQSSSSQQQATAAPQQQQAAVPSQQVQTQVVSTTAIKSNAMPTTQIITSSGSSSYISSQPGHYTAIASGSDRNHYDIAGQDYSIPVQYQASTTARGYAPASSAMYYL